MFSEKTKSVINSIKQFGQNRKGVIRVYFPDETFRDISAQEISELTFKDFAEIALELDSDKIAVVRL